jgi:hypothetical protein
MPAVSFEQLKANYARCVEGVQSPFDPRPKQRFAKMIAEQIGLCDERGEAHTRPDGFPTLAKERKRRVADFPLAMLAEATIGRDWQQSLGLGSSGSAFPVRRWLSEEAAAPVGPSVFSNVSAWTAAVGALVQGQVLEGYETSDFDLADLFPTRPVTFWNGAERFTNVMGPSEPAPKVGPGESHPDARLDSLWVEPGPMSKYGNKLLITKETAFVDINGRVMSAARELGTAVRFRENELVLDVLCGQTNNFKLGIGADASATGYNTFGATVPTGNGTTGTLANDLTNPMLDPITTFQASDDGLTVYKHPVTGLPMPHQTRLNTIVLPTTLNNWAMFLNGLASLSILNQPGAPAPAAAGTFPTGSMTGDNPYRNRFNIRVSQWLYDRHTRSTTQTNPNISAGLGLTATNARRWYRLDPERFAARRAAWEMQSMDLNPNDFVMADQGIVWGQVVNIAVQIQVLNPWAIQRNKVA